MNSRHAVTALLLGMILCVVGCSSTRTVRVPVPPRVDLARYQTIGIVRFAANNGDGELERMSTQRFLAAVQEAQPGTRIVELGSETKVLGSIKRKTWDPAALRAVGKEHEVDAVFTGRIDVTSAKPQVSLSTVWKNVDVRADVTAAVSARLYETESGATAWTDSGKLTENVAGANFDDKGRGSAGARDPKGAYGNMVDCIVVDITDAFRTHYVLERLPKEQVQSASAGD